MKRVAWILIRDFHQRRTRDTLDVIPLDVFNRKDEAIAVMQVRDEQARSDRYTHHVVRVEYELDRRRAKRL